MKVLDEKPEGIRWTDLLRAVEEGTPETPHNSVHGAIHNLLKTNTSEVVKIARGTYKLAKYVELEGLSAKKEPETSSVTAEIGSEALTEQDFYSSFADWLVENDEATAAKPLGGSSLGGKWGTPDVIGVLRPRAQDIFKFEPQIVSAEIKAVPNQPVTAFGQAVAYRLFSHKSYIVVPNSTGIEDLDRLKSLCSIHGVGLVTFTLNKEQPDYLVIVLPVKTAPDVFYVNSMLENLQSKQSNLLNKLFS